MIIDDELIKTNPNVYGTNKSPEEQMTGTEATKWTLLTGVGLPSGKTGKVYAYNSVIPKDTTKVQDAKGFENFTLDSGLSSDQIAALDGKRIIVNGAAIQSDGFDSAEAAWKAVYGTVETTKILYQVAIWRIGQDGPNTITFGPATGASNTCLDVDGKHEHCIHNDRWEDIIKNINEGNADYYSECLTNGCTHSVELELNDTIVGDKTKAGSKASVLYSAINSNYRKWNNSYLDTDCESANWATSRIRATLNGKTGFESTYAGANCLDSSNCLLSCFPGVLQSNIKAKTYKVPTTWSTTSPYTINSSTSVSDKLWLPCASETYGDVSSYQSGRYNETSIGNTWQYTKKANESTTTSSYSNNKAFNEDGSANSWWLRGPYRLYRCFAGSVLGCGSLSGYNVSSAYYGLSPCFIL